MWVLRILFILSVMIALIEVGLILRHAFNQTLKEPGIPNVV